MPIRVTGVGAALPKTAVSNDELAATLDTSDRWIRTRTGIGQRWIADESESSSTLAVTAARRALRTAGTSSVDLLVLATSTPDRSIPATAPLVACELGLQGIPAFDVNAVCTGFLYALTPRTHCFPPSTRRRHSS